MDHFVSISAVCSLQCVILVSCSCAFPLVHGCLDSSLTFLCTLRTFMSLCASCALVLLYSLCGTKAFWPVRVRPQPHWVQGNAARPLDISIYEPYSCFVFCRLIVLALSTFFRPAACLASSLRVAFSCFLVRSAPYGFSRIRTRSTYLALSTCSQHRRSRHGVSLLVFAASLSDLIHWCWIISFSSAQAVRGCELP